MNPKPCLLLMLLLGAPPSYGLAAERCGDGMGGGIGGMGGMGGTGATDQRESPTAPSPLPAPSGGIGGTGLTPLPAGSHVAFVGVITRFGSICVNGDRLQYDDKTPTLYNGRPGHARDLHIGQVVRAEAVVGATDLQATRIGVIDAVSGPVTRREEAMRRFWIMGQRVQLDDDTAIGISGPTVPEIGTPVRASGLMTLDGGLVASRIERAELLEAALVTGRLTELDGRAAEVGTVRVRLPANAASLPLAPGREVSVFGRWTGEMLEADTVDFEPRFAFAVPPDLVSVEGFVHGCTDGAGIGLDGIDLRAPPGLDMGARPGSAVVVVGVPRPDGGLTALRFLPAGPRAPVVSAPADPDSANRIRTLTRCQPRLAPARTTP